MNKTYKVAIPLALILVGISTGGAGNGTELTNDTAAAIPDQGGSTDARYECGGTAPDELWCSTGQHVRSGFISHGFPAVQAPGFTGWIENVLISANGEVRFRCQWEDGAWTGNCGVIASLWPSVGMEFRHECWVYAEALPDAPYELVGLPHGQDPLPQSAPSGVPGGIGDWICFVSV